MNVTFSEKEIAFREEVRQFFREEYPADILEKQARSVSLTRDDYVR